MRFQRGIVLVLLVDEEAARLGLVPVHLVHGASRFLAGLFGEFFKQCGNFGFVPNLRHPGNCQHHHRSLLPAAGPPGRTILGFLRGRLQLRNELVHQNRMVAVGAGGNHADLRSGFFFHECQIFARLSCGSFSNSVMPSVEVFQPGSLR